jgi:hypothetical protein
VSGVAIMLGSRLGVVDTGKVALHDRAKKVAAQAIPDAGVGKSHTGSGMASI